MPVIIMLLYPPYTIGGYTVLHGFRLPASVSPSKKQDFYKNKAIIIIIIIILAFQPHKV